MCGSGPRGWTGRGCTPGIFAHGTQLVFPLKIVPVKLHSLVSQAQFVVPPLLLQGADSHSQGTQLRRLGEEPRDLLHPREAEAFFSMRFSRILDTFGYAIWRRWRVYGEEGLAGREATLWLRKKTSLLSTAGSPSHVTMWSTIPIRRSRGRSHVPCSSRPPIAYRSSGSLGWTPWARKGGSKP